MSRNLIFVVWAYLCIICSIFEVIVSFIGRVKRQCEPGIESTRGLLCCTSMLVVHDFRDIEEGDEVCPGVWRNLYSPFH